MNVLLLTEEAVNKLIGVKTPIEPPTLQQLAGRKLMEIIFSIFEIVRQGKLLLCYCHKIDNVSPYSVIEFPVCTVCQLCKFSHYYFKQKARNDLRYLIKTYRDFVKKKDRILKNTVGKNIYFNHDYEYAFFMGCIFSQNIGLYEVISPYELCF